MKKFNKLKVVQMIIFIVAAAVSVIVLLRDLNPCGSFQVFKSVRKSDKFFTPLIIYCGVSSLGLCLCELRNSPFLAHLIGGTDLSAPK